MLTPHTPAQRVFLQAATPGQIATFLSRGPAEVGQYLNLEKRETVFRAAIRGVVIAGDPYPTAGAAMEAAEAELKAIKNGEKVPLAELDEEALGISSRNIQIHEAASVEGTLVRFPKLMHIGLQIAEHYDYPPDVFEDFIEDLLGESAWVLAGLKQGLPWIEKFAKEDSETDTNEAWSDFCERAHRNGTLGFLVYASRPAAITYGEGSKSYSWGMTTGRWLYAETIEAAIELGVKWAAGEERKERTKQKKGAKA